MERISSKTVYEGPIADVRIDEFRYDDGETAERQIVVHPGAVAIVAHDDRFVYLVRQPREAVGVPDLLEVPAGKLDPGERLEPVEWPLDDLDGALEACHDSKSLIALLLLTRMREGSRP